jgi:WD40 repeat protein
LRDQNGAGSPKEEAMIDHRHDACSIRTRQRWVYLSVLLLSGLAVRPARANGLDIVWKRSASTPTTRGAVVAFSPDGQVIASGTRVSGNKAIELWRSSDGALLRTLILPLPLQAPDGEDIYAIAFSPDGRLLATSHVYGTVRLWHVSDGSLVHTLTAAGNKIGALLHPIDPGGRVWAAALSPDSHFIAYGLAEPATVVVARNPGEALSEQAQTQQR